MSIYLNQNVTEDMLLGLGFEFYESNEFNWFECYKKHIRSFTNIIIDFKSKEASIKYDDDFEHKYHTEDEMLIEPEILSLFKKNILYVKI
jgi:hypothetical protein